MDDAQIERRLAGLYDALNADRPDLGLYLRLADSLGARTVVDIGCGTGLLAVALAREDRLVTGVDPADEMLRVARSRADGDLVTWIDDVADLSDGTFDLAVMTGYVAQIFLDDAEWAELLADVRRVLRPGGTFAFAVRDPRAGAWRSWTREGSRRLVVIDGDPVETWREVTAVDNDVVTYDTRLAFSLSGEQMVTTNSARFVHREHLIDTVTLAGFGVDRVLGDWSGGPVTEGTTELIVVATPADRADDQPVEAPEARS